MKIKCDDLNVRQMQAYAGICLLAFCNYFSIKNNSIDELVKHLLFILIAKNLPDWEQAGARLVLTGRGDPIPVEINQSIPEGYRDIFHTLVECCVEVGIVDMYGACTEQPRFFFNRCISIVESLNIEIPSLELINSVSNGSDRWGKAVSEDELRKFIQDCGLESSRLC